MDQIYMILGFLLMFITIVMAIFLLIFYITYVKKSITYDDENQAIAVVDIIELLRRVCPVGLEKNWKLFPLNCGPVRCWSRQLSFPVLNINIQLYASTMAMNCSALQLLHLIADVSQWGEWEPSGDATGFYATALTESQLKKDNFMHADQVLCLTKDKSVQSSLSMFRFIYLTKDDIGCVLLWNTRKIEFKFFLVQQCTTNNSESECCLVTHIVGTHGTKQDHDIMSFVVQRLRNMNDAIQISSLNATTFNFLSISPFMFHEKNYDHSLVERKALPKIFKLSPTTYLTRNEVPQAFVLVPFSYDVRCYLWNLKGFHISIRKLEQASIFVKKNDKKISAVTTSGSSKISVTKDAYSTSAFSKTASQNFKQTLSSFSASKNRNKSENLNAETEILNTDTRKISISQSDKNSNVPQIKQFKLTTNITNPSQDEIKERNQFTSQNDSDIVETGCISKPKIALETTLSTCYGNEDESFEDNKNSDKEGSFHDKSYLHPDKLCVSDDDLMKPNKLPTDASSARLSEFEIILPYDQISDSKIADFVTQGNYCASELQAELLQVSSLNLLSSVEDQKLSCRGWMYHSNYKGILVYTKVSSSGYLRTISYMCEAVISVPSKDIWKLVMNPRSRFICDETVKKVRILEHLPNGQKIIHTYHESSSLLKKEAVDFCLLHTEREENNKFYLTFHSVEYENCPLMDSVVRGILLPSGWVVQELEDPKTSKISYLIQILVNSPDNMLIQELSMLVPTSVYNLTNFLILKPL